MRELEPVTVPQMNPNDETAVLVRWHIAAGSKVDENQSIATLETTKAAFDVHAPRAGYVFFDHEPSSIVPVGSAIAWISASQTRPQQLPAASAPPPKSDKGSPEAGASRKALRLMKEHGLQPADFAGLERITTADVERVARERGAKRTAPAQKQTQPQPQENAQPLEQSASKIIEVQALGEVYRHAVPSMVSVSVSVARSDAHLAALAAKMGSISLLEAVIYHVGRLLGQFPELNAYYADGRAWRAGSIAVGFAVNIGRSLRVPVVRRTDELSQLDVARAVRDLSLRYMRDELKMEDLTGGTFTVTDLSSYEATHFVPVINQRQSAILGVCAPRPGTGCRDLVLSFDHRLSDGMQAAKFLCALRDLLEEGPAE